MQKILSGAFTWPRVALGQGHLAEDQTSAHAWRAHIQE